MDDLAERVRYLGRRLKVLADKIGRTEELATTIEYELERLEQAIEAGSLPMPDAGAPPRRTLPVRVALRQTAEQGALLFELKRLSDGSAAVRVDAGKAFQLPPALADLLSVLAAEGGPSEDGLVGWKTLEEVRIVMTKKTGKPTSKHAVTQQVYRLRREILHRGGVNPFLIQSHRRHGLRFARRTKPVPVIHCDRPERE